MSDNDDKGIGAAGYIGGAAVAAGAGALMTNRQINRLVEGALDGAPDVYKTGKQADFKKVVDGAANFTPEGKSATFATRYAQAKHTLASTTANDEVGKKAISAAKEEIKEVVKGVRSALPKDSKTLISLTAKQYGKVGAAVVAGAVVGGMVFNALFGGKNTNRINSERNQEPETAPAR